MNRTSKLTTQKAKEEYLEKHVINDLHWLVRSTYEWIIQDALQLCIGGYHVQVHAMDSTFMHARALFEFLTSTDSPNHYSVKNFGLQTSLKSKLYDEWRDQIHSHTGIHLQNRNNVKELATSTNQTKSLNKMPPEFTKEIIRLWNEFIKELKDKELKKIAKKGLKDVLNQAQGVLNSINNGSRGTLYANVNSQTRKKIKDQILGISK